MSVDTKSSSSPRARTVPRSSLLRQLCDALVVLAVAVILFRTFQVEGYMISTGSMAPSLFGYHKRVVCPTCGYLFAAGVSFDDSVAGTMHARAAGPLVEAASRGRTGTAAEGSASTSDSAAAATDVADDDQHPRVEFAESDESSSAPTSTGSATPRRLPAVGAELATCPNCGQARIDIGRVVRNQGDQLLVHKNAWLMRKPKRWEVVVFRNPQKPTEAYVKRVAGLPGERIRVRDGDVYADGRLCRKSLATRRAMRIPVYDLAFDPRDDALWQPRWQPEPAQLERGRGVWQRTGNSFGFRPRAAGDTEKETPEDHNGELAWLRYRHWVRSGGTHRTLVTVPPEVDDAELSELNLFPAEYDSESRELTCEGALPVEWYNRLINQVESVRAADAVERLFDESHYGVISDSYGYNRPGDVRAHRVRDVMIDLRVQFGSTAAVLDEQNLSGSNRENMLVLRLRDGYTTADLQLHPYSGDVRLILDGDEAVPARMTQLPTATRNRPMQIEFSLFDRQIRAAVNGEELFAPWSAPAAEESVPVPRVPVEIGAAGVPLRIGSLQLYRDVYYTEGRGVNAVHEEYRLKTDEYFMLGDNSPVSSDSRSWPHGGVPAKLLLGKPFVVHLPSRPGRIHLGGRTLTVRIPDFSRIHYIH